MKCPKCGVPYAKGTDRGQTFYVCLQHGLAQATESKVSSLAPTGTASRTRSATEANVVPSSNGSGGRSKYGNRRTEVDGISFQSKKEADRYRELKMMEAAGEITHLQLQPKYDLIVNGVSVGKYIADFIYLRGASVIVEDAKGFKTAVYRLKKKIFEVLYGELTEV